MSHSHLADEDLMQLVRRGDAAAFETVYERHSTAAFSLAYRMTGKRGPQLEKLLLEGALPQDVDRVMEAYGMAMGPCATGDLAGLDIGAAGRKARGTVAEPETEDPVSVATAAVKAAAKRAPKKRR